MQEITLIKIEMTMALFFYASAITLGVFHRRWGLPRWTHFSCGLIGFSLDMWATWEMEQLRHNGWNMDAGGSILFAHTWVSLLAIILFLTMFGLGVGRKIKYHRILSLYIFLPVWLFSYGSGLFLVATQDQYLVSNTSATQVKP
ncbi:MAG: hypothetical protein OEZ58_03645 [Gammaproteobacteria bacterium]|nr:hypothetical protein [Gammaproteobacteria bacterium]MDH5728057.1 hypothetical protein [Gammaproteobacteria bacterium]